MREGDERCAVTDSRQAGRGGGDGRPSRASGHRGFWRALPFGVRKGQGGEVRFHYLSLCVIFSC